MMSERKKKMNERFWDGLHEFHPVCFTCEFLATDQCLGCKMNLSGESNNYTPIEWKE
jgi:hypothetical protein